jgi:hypothetical protein
MKMLHILPYKIQNILRKKKNYIRFLLLLIVSSLLLAHIIIKATALSDSPLSISISIVETTTFGPGETFHTITEIRNREPSGRIDVSIQYQILDSNRNTILSSRETVAVETKSSFVGDFKLPEGIPEGLYYLTANVSTLDGSKWSEVSQTFQVVVISVDTQNIIEFIVIAIFIFTGLAWFFEHRRISKLKVSAKDLYKFIEEQKKK